MTTIINKYSFDGTGKEPNNLVTGEVHTLEDNSNGLILPKHGTYYTDSLVVYKDGEEIDDYKAAHVNPDVQELTGLDARAVVIIEVPDSDAVYSLDYRVVGGIHALTSRMLADAADSLSNELTITQYDQIIGLPTQFSPTDHLHMISDLYGMEYLIDAIHTMTTSIENGSNAERDALEAQINQKMNSSDFTAQAVYDLLLDKLANGGTIDAETVGGLYPSSFIRTNTDIVTNNSWTYGQAGRGINFTSGGYDSKVVTRPNSIAGGKDTSGLDELNSLHIAVDKGLSIGSTDSVLWSFDKVTPAFKSSTDVIINEDKALQLGDVRSYASGVNFYTILNSSVWNIKDGDDNVRFVLDPVEGDLTVANQITATKVETTSSGQGDNVRIGDDAYIGDIDRANTLVVKGVINPASGYIAFGNTNTDVTLGKDGSGHLMWGPGQIWHSANDGAGSGLDADLLDGLQSNQFLRSDSTTTKTSGHLNFNENVAIRLNGAADLYGSSNQINFTFSDDVDLYYRLGGTQKFKFDMTEGDLYLSGKVVAPDGLAGNSDTATKLQTARSITVGNTGKSFDGTSNISFSQSEIGYTASDVLTKLKTVDGSGSGLDADLLDGLQSSQFLRSDVADNKTVGELRFYDNVYLRLGTDGDIEHFSNGSHYYTDINNGGNWYIRDGDASNSARFILDVTAGDFTVSNQLISNKVVTTSNGLADNIRIGDDAYIGDVNRANTIAVKGYNDDTSGYIAFGTSDTSVTLGRSGTGHLMWGPGQIWHSANDGSGSGLDADLWDGNQFSSYLNQGVRTTDSPTFSKLNLSSSPGEMANLGGSTDHDRWLSFYGSGEHGWMLKYRGSTGNATGNEIGFESMSTGNSLYFDHLGDLEVTRSSAVSKVWDSGNDGSGSGLDADLLDGLDSSRFLRSDANDTATGVIDFSGGIYAKGIRLKRNSSSGPGDDITEIWQDDTTVFFDIDNDSDGDVGTFVFRRKVDGSYVNASVVGDFIGNSSTATVLQTTRTLTVGNTSKSFNGSANVSWSQAEIGYTATDVLTKLKTVDGSGSGLDSDLWDGNQFSSFLNQGVRTTDSPTHAGMTLNGTVTFNDTSRYWLVTSGTWGLYWDTSTNQLQYRGSGGAIKHSTDLDTGDTVSEGTITSNTGQLNLASSSIVYNETEKSIDFIIN